MFLMFFFLVFFCIQSFIHKAEGGGAKGLSRISIFFAASLSASETKEQNWSIKSVKICSIKFEDKMDGQNVHTHKQSTFFPLKS